MNSRLNSGVLVDTLQTLIAIAQAHKTLGHKIVMTTGVYDLTHIGHCRYLSEALKRGDILIVIVDSDAATKIRKGDDRPVVPESERAEMLAHLRYVDYVLIDPSHFPDGNTTFDPLQQIKPDVFIASERSFTDEQLAFIAEHAGTVEVLPSQAETSTSAKVRKLVLGPWREIRALITQLGNDVSEKITNLLGLVDGKTRE